LGKKDRKLPGKPETPREREGLKKFSTTVLDWKHTRREEMRSTPRDGGKEKSPENGDLTGTAD